MKKIIRLTESDLEKIVRRIIQEQPAPEKELRKITLGWMIPTVQDLEASAKKVFGELGGAIPGQTKTPTFTEFMKRGEAFDKEQLQELVNGAINMAYQRVKVKKLPLYQLSDFYTKVCNAGQAFCYSYTEGNELEKNQALEVGQRKAYGQVQNATFEMLKKLGNTNKVQDLNIGGPSKGALVF